MEFFERLRENREIKKAFRKYINPTILQKILDDGIKVLDGKKQKILFFVLCLKQDEKFFEHLATVVEFAQSTGFVVDLIDTVLVKLTYGSGLPEQGGNLQAAKSRFLEMMPPDISTTVSGIFGIEECFVGNIGSPARMTWTVVIEKYKERLQTLLALRDGQIIEVDYTQAE